MTHAEAGRKGAEWTMILFGREHLERIAPLGGQTSMARLSLEQRREFARQGQAALLAKHGKGHYTRAGRAGGRKMGSGRRAV
jgi:hypothetical protein